MKSTIQGQQALTFARHCEIGEDLHNTLGLLYSLREELSRVPKNQYATKARASIMAAVTHIEYVQQHMEHLLCTTPCIAEATKNPCNVYYGPFNEVAK